MSFSTNSSPGNVVPGLTTPNLNGGKVSGGDAATQPLAEDSRASKHLLQENDVDTDITNNKLNNSVFEIALDLEEKLRELNHTIDEHDTEVTSRIDKLLTRIKALERKIS